MANRQFFCTLLVLASVLTGCRGDMIHETMAYNDRQATIKENNKNLMAIQIGVSSQEVRQLMGDPERSEGYTWGHAWLYRTAMTSGVYGTVDADFTPVVFDSSGKLVGWGRNFFTEHVKRYDITVREE